MFLVTCSTSVRTEAASYQQTDGTIVDPILDTNDSPHGYSGVNLESYTDLAGANLNSANLTDANLTDANLTDANLANASLTNANLTDANLENADLYSTNLFNANNLEGTTGNPHYYPNTTLPPASIQLPKVGP